MVAIWSSAFSLYAFGQSPTIAGLGYLYPPAAVAPGQLITVFLAGDVAGGISATVQGFTAPVFEVRPASACAQGSVCANLSAVTVQIPYELQLGCGTIEPVCNVLVLTQLIVTVNGVAGVPLTLFPVGDSVHILTACDTAVPSGSGIGPTNGLSCQPLVTHADGSLVTAGSPAQAGEELVAYAAGLGATTPAVPTGQAADTATPTAETFALNFDFQPNALAAQPMLPPLVTLFPSYATPLYSGLVPGYAGLYQVNFIVPPPPAGVVACSGTVQTNLTVSVGGLFTFDGAGICVAP
jgi:uncharacterized protein (TIGR03437 family)